LRQRHAINRPDPFAALPAVEAPPAEPPTHPLGLTGVSTDLLADGVQVVAVDVPGRQLILREGQARTLVTCRQWACLSDVVRTRGLDLLDGGLIDGFPHKQE